MASSGHRFPTSARTHVVLQCFGMTSQPRLQDSLSTGYGTGYASVRNNSQERPTSCFNVNRGRE